MDLLRYSLWHKHNDLLGRPGALARPEDRPGRPFDIYAPIFPDCLPGIFVVALQGQA